MAKRKKVLPARKQRDRSREDESLLMRSAESLGRMIGSLQRQLDGAGKRVSEAAEDVMGSLPDIPLGGKSGTKTTRKKEKKTTARTKKTAARKRSAGKATAGTRKTGSSRTRRTTKSSKKR